MCRRNEQGKSGDTCGGALLKPCPSLGRQGLPELQLEPDFTNLKL